MWIKKQIPNAITCLNLFIGCIAILYISNNMLDMAAYCIGIAAIFDFFDGLAARVLHVSSEIGKQLDSLADMVSFGLVPGYIMHKLLVFSLKYNSESIDETNPTFYLSYFGFLITIFSAIRLAKFNIDTRQTNSFIGLPTPANSFLIGSVALLLFTTQNEELKKLILNPSFLIGLTVLSSYLLVAEIPLFALKFKNFKLKGNEIRYVFLIISLITFVLFKIIAIPIILLLYIVISLLFKTKTS
ncbi:MAG: CDP-alcohol phosphatidyltransferase family protein [Bacteroidota bacterium]